MEITAIIAEVVVKKMTDDNNNKTTTKEITETSSYDDLVAAIKYEHRKKCKSVIPMLCYALKREKPGFTDAEIRKQVFTDCRGLWSEDWIRGAIPDEFKSKKMQEIRAMGNKKPKEKHHHQYVAKADEMIENVRELVLYLAGVKNYDQLYELSGGVRRQLVEKTKDHRFNIIKQLAYHELRQLTGVFQDLHYLTKDFVMTLDQEWEIQKSKNEMTSI